MVEELVPDELSERIEPVLPPAPARRFYRPGRRRVDDRAALAGIVFVLKTGITWGKLPRLRGMRLDLPRSIAAGMVRNTTCSPTEAGSRSR